MFVNEKFLCIAGGKNNEDVCNINKNFAYVIDGATGFNKENITDKPSDAQWYSNKWDFYLKNHLGKNKPLLEILKNGLEYLNKEYSKFKRSSEVSDKPSAACGIVKEQGQFIEYFVMCDCPIFIKMKNGKIKKIQARKIGIYDNYTTSVAVKTAKEKNINVIDAVLLVKEEYKKIRKLKNKDKGYQVLSFLDTNLKKGLYGRINKNEIESITICSDGFSCFYSLFNICKNQKDFLNKIESMPLKNLYDKLYELQEKDASCNEFPRAKKRDDASVVNFKIK